MPFEGFAACKPYGLHIFLADIHKTVVPYCSTLHLHGPFTASVVVIYIFEHLHTRIVMFHNKYASLRLHDSNATSPSTSQEYFVMHSVCFDHGYIEDRHRG